VLVVGLRAGVSTAVITLDASAVRQLWGYVLILIMSVLRMVAYGVRSDPAGSHRSG
jgi:hypothetical protein